MSITERVKHIAGRWFDSHYTGPTDKPQPDASAAFDIQSCDDGTGLWLPAGLVSVHDEINVAGRWFTVTGMDVWKPCGVEPGFATLHFGGWSHRSGFASRVYVRDEAALIGAQLKAVCDGNG